MTCRIDRLRTTRGLVLHISGRITRADLDILRAALADGSVVALELAELQLIDREGVQFLASIEANGVELQHCPAYIREWVSKEQDGNGL